MAFRAAVRHRGRTLQLADPLLTPCGAVEYIPAAQWCACAGCCAPKEPEIKDDFARGQRKAAAPAAFTPGRTNAAAQLAAPMAGRAEVAFRQSDSWRTGGQRPDARHYRPGDRRYFSPQDRNPPRLCPPARPGLWGIRQRKS